MPVNRSQRQIRLAALLFANCGHLLAAQDLPIVEVRKASLAVAATSE